MKVSENRKPLAQPFLRAFSRGVAFIHGLSSVGRVGVLVVIGTAAAVAWTTGCTWGWADNGCNDADCRGECSNGTTVVNTATYCQTQGNGLYCCQCTEVAYRCVKTGPCLTSFNYVRTKLQALESSCASGPNGLQCVF